MKRFLTVFVLSFILQFFIPSWTGNGYSHMNFFILEHPMEISDEISVFSGDECVGVVTVKEEGVLSLVASMSDGNDGGFKNGDSIIFKAYDYSENEVISLKPEYIKSFENSNFSGEFKEHSSTFIYLSKEMTQGDSIITDILDNKLIINGFGDKNFNIKIHSITGVLLKYEYNDNKVNLSDLENGIYVMTVFNSEKSYSKVFLFQK